MTIPAWCGRKSVARKPRAGFTTTSLSVGISLWYSCVWSSWPPSCLFWPTSFTIPPPWKNCPTWHWPFLALIKRTGPGEITRVLRTPRRTLQVLLLRLSRGSPFDHLIIYSFILNYSWLFICMWKNHMISHFCASFWNIPFVCSECKRTCIYR